MLGAVVFLTRVPVPARAFGDDPFDLAPALPWFPLVGGAVGAVSGGVLVGLAPVVGPAPSTVIAIAALVLVTGALHQDGLADSFDGFGVRGDRQRRLAVMRDSTVGTFGVLALIIWAMLLLTALDQIAPIDALRTLVAAEALSRFGALLHGIGASPARPDGLGALMPSKRLPAAVAGVVALAIAFVSVGGVRTAVGLAVTLASAVITALVARRALGGSTGDTLGATVALTEALVTVAVVAAWR